jgi:hypothetical protein
MTKEEFETFLEQRGQATREAKLIDWESRKRDWLLRLGGFYSTIEGYLAHYKNSGKLKVDRSKVPLTEEHIGTYQADAMDISIGSDKVTLAPIGTLLIGARGRVDMTGPAGTVKFVLTGRHSNGIRISVPTAGENPPAREASPQPSTPEEFMWKIATPPPKIRFIELGAETFFSALTEVVNG